MGKTLGSILAVAAAIAVNVIPGVGQALSAAIGTTLATSVISAVTLYGLQSAASLLGIGASSVKPDTTETAIKTSRPPRVSAYGRSRLYGAYILYETASNGTAVDVYAVHDGQMDGVEVRYLSDEAVTLTGTAVNQGADGRYKGGAVNFYTTSGAAPGAGIPAITALVPTWTGRGDGVVLLGLTAKSVKAKNFQEIYPQSSVPVPSLVARWQRCPDPFAPNPLDEAGWTWTENGPRHLLHYALVREGPRPALPRNHPNYAAQLAALRQAWWARKIAPTLDYWKRATLDADSAVPLRAGGTEPRYRSCVAHKHTDQHKDAKAAILATFDGWIAPRADGALVVYSGRYTDPDPADLIGPSEIVSYTWDGGDVDDDQAVNEIICSYVSAAHNYNTVECDAWRDEDDITRRGQVLSAPLDAQVPSNGQSRRLAKRRMARTNARNRGTITTNVAGRKVRGKRYIPLHLEEAGTVFFSGVAEITALTRNVRGGVTFSWVAADPNVDAWNAATEEGDPAAVGNRVASLPLDAPTITDAFVLFTDATEEGSGGQVRLTVAAPERDDLTWYARWRVQGASVWNEQAYTDIDPGPAVVLQTGFVPLDKTIEVEAAYQVGDGRVSPYSNPPTLVDSAVDAEPPEAAVAVTLTNWGDTMDLSTDSIPRARSYRWRIYAALNTAPTLYPPFTGQYRIQRGDVQRTASQGWNGNVYGVRPIPDNCVVIGRFDTSDTFIGLSEGREFTGGNDEYQNIDYALHYSSDGSLYVFELGAFENRGPAPEGVAMQPGRSVAISYLNGVITFFIINDAGEWVVVTARSSPEGRSFYPAAAMYATGGSVSQLQFRLFNNNRVTAPPTVLSRTINTTGRSVSYTKAQALADGPSRSYRVAVAGINGAGAGEETISGLLTNTPPPQVTGVAVPDDPTTGAVSFNLLDDVPDLAGYKVAYSTAAHFDPYTQGFLVDNLGNPPAYLYGLAAGTYYAKVAAYDTWSDNPDLLCFSDEDSFTIATGGGGSGGGGGTGGGGGGYCVTTDTPVLMADGTQKAAGAIAVGDRVRTQHETTMEWGDFEVVAAETVDSDDVWHALGLRGTGDHRVWLNGWVKLRDIGERVEPAQVVKLTVDQAHTYYSAGILSHNIKTRPELVDTQ